MKFSDFLNEGRPRRVEDDVKLELENLVGEYKNDLYSSTVKGGKTLYLVTKIDLNEGKFSSQVFWRFNDRRHQKDIDFPLDKFAEALKMYNWHGSDDWEENWRGEDAGKKFGF
jgi:hypothetical protein